MQGVAANATSETKSDEEQQACFEREKRKRFFPTALPALILVALLRSELLDLFRQEVVHFAETSWAHSMSSAPGQG